MTEEMHNIKVLLRVLGVRIEAGWIPSDVNLFDNKLSRTWDPGDVYATAGLVASMKEENIIYLLEFSSRPMGENTVTRRKYLWTQMGNTGETETARYSGTS